MASDDDTAVIVACTSIIFAESFSSLNSLAKLARILFHLARIFPTATELHAMYMTLYQQLLKYFLKNN